MDKITDRSEGITWAEVRETFHSKNAQTRHSRLITVIILQSVISGHQFLCQCFYTIQCYY